MDKYKNMTHQQRIESLKKNGVKLFPNLSNEQKLRLLIIDTKNGVLASNGK